MAVLVVIFYFLVVIQWLPVFSGHLTICRCHLQVIDGYGGTSDRQLADMHTPANTSTAVATAIDAVSDDPFDMLDEPGPGSVT